MSVCELCGRESTLISAGLGLCAACVQRGGRKAREYATEAHHRERRRFGLPGSVPRSQPGARCRQCANGCRIAPGQVGYCGVRANKSGRLIGGDAAAAAVSWYHDALPTNCVADWVCPASTSAGYPRFTDTRDPEHGYTNLAVFYEACSFDCLFCQNWHFREHSISGPRRTAAELAAAVDQRTRCICYFGGDPSCQMAHALKASRLALDQAGNRILRICWETNGSMSRSALRQAVQLSLETGGCIKFDLKAWDRSLHRALCGVSNRRTLANFDWVSQWIQHRPDPPLLIASTLLIPGYVDAEQVGRLARFIAQRNRDIPCTLLAFHPRFAMSDLPTTSREHAERCLAAAREAGLTRVHLGNLHLLS
ncbi:MAG: radical SAM protein [Planctomycetes bacterium]|nr:radical SAM protein [Planctomycetota bacterium]